MTKITNREYGFSQNGHIFRAEALEYHAQRKQEIIWPQIALPKIILYLWILLFILVLANIVLWFLFVPLYFSGG
jgi:hypothetical protein